MKMLLTDLAFLLLACGGKATVDLGGSSANAGWSDTKGSQVPATSGALAVPQTLYQGDYVRAIAVDETTIAATIQSKDGTRIEMCQLADCKGTLQTIYSVAADVCYPFQYLSNFDYLIVSHGEAIWPTCVPDVTSGLNGGNLLACATSGCPSGPRRIANVGEVLALTAGEDSVYWLERGASYAVARCPRGGCETPEQHPLSIADQERLFFTEAGDGIGGGAWRLALDELRGVLYVSCEGGLASIPVDFSSDLTGIYKDSVGVAGLSVIGEYVYFTLPLLSGQIRRCPVSGCDAPEVVAAAAGWPLDPIGDEKAVYWTHRAPEDYGSSDAQYREVISRFSLDGTSTSAKDIATFEHLQPSWQGPHPTINSHHVYWCAAEMDTDGSMTNALAGFTGPPTDLMRSTIRMVAR